MKANAVYKAKLRNGSYLNYDSGISFFTTTKFIPCQRVLSVQVLATNTKRIDHRWALESADIHAAPCYLDNAVGAVTPKGNNRGRQGKSVGHNTRIPSSRQAATEISVSKIAPDNRCIPAGWLHVSQQAPELHSALCFGWCTATPNNHLPPG